MVRTYAHWLDGDYRTALTGVTRDRQWSSADDRSERLIKVAVLFGTGFDLSDAQLVDSPVLWRQFRDPRFRECVRQDLDFFRLIARPVEGIANDQDRRWPLAVAGLHRAVAAGRIGSPMHEPEFLVRVYERILESGPGCDLGALLHEKRRAADYDALEGFIETFRFFANGPGDVAIPPAHRPHSTYYGVLHEVRDNRNLTGTDRKLVEQTIASIDQLVPDPDARIKRNQLFRKLAFDRPRDRASWAIAVQAWNVAAQRSVTDGAGSIANFETVPIAAYVGKPVEVILDPIGLEQDRETPTVRWSSPVAWDPGNLSWSEIYSITTSDQGVRARAAWRRATDFGDIDDARAAVEQLSNAVHRFSRGRVTDLVRPWMWRVATGVLSAGATLAITFGAPGSELPWKVMAGGFAGGAASQPFLEGIVHRWRRHCIYARLAQESARLVNEQGS